MAKNTDPNNPATVRPSMASVSPRFAAANAKYAELHKRAAELEVELRPLVQEVNRWRRGSGGGFDEFERQVLELPRQPLKPIEASPRAKELLGDELAPAPKMPGDPREILKIKHPHYVRMRDLSRELDAVREALGHLSETLEYERKKASLALAPLLRDEYAQIARQYASALVALGQARRSSRSRRHPASSWPRSTRSRYCRASFRRRIRHWGTRRRR